MHNIFDYVFFAIGKTVVPVRNEHSFYVFDTLLKVIKHCLGCLCHPRGDELRL